MSKPVPEIARDRLLAYLRSEGFRVSPYQLLRWHDRGLLPQPRRVGLGRAKGTTTFYPGIAALQARALAKLLSERRSLVDAGWGLWVLGFPLTNWARELLVSELETQQANLLKAKKALMRPRGALTRQLSRPRPPRQLKPMRKVVRPESMPRLFGMMLDFGLGDLKSENYTDEEWAGLQDGLVHQLFPAFVDNPDLASIEEVRTDMQDLSQQINVGATLAALRELPDARLEQYRNEAQWLEERFSPPDQRLKGLVSPEDFLGFFKYRHLLPDPEGSMSALIRALGQDHIPTSALRRWQMSLSLRGASVVPAAVTAEAEA